MKKLYLLNFSQLIKSSPENFRKSIVAFAEHTHKDIKVIAEIAHIQGGSCLTAYKPNEMLLITQGAIYLYKTGEINDDTFINRMNMTLGSHLNRDDFMHCWNAMSTISPESIEYMRQIEQLQNQHNFILHILSNTNPMHTNYIDQQLNDNNIALRTRHTYSYEVGVFNPKPPTAEQAAAQGYEIVDLRDVDDILTEIAKLETTVKSTPAAKAAPGFNL